MNGQEMADYPINEQITFVVERRNGGIESPSIIYDLLPERLTNKHSKHLLVYAVRLDRLPNGLEMAKLGPQELYRQFVEQRKTSRLPQSNLIGQIRQSQPRNDEI